MNKNFIVSSLLLSSLLYLGCATKEPSITYIEEENSFNTQSYTDDVLGEQTNQIEEISTPAPMETNSYIPDIKYHDVKTIQGETLTVGEHARGFYFPKYKDKIILLQFFGKECHYCFEEMPTINRIQNKYIDKLAVIAIQSTPPMSKEEGERLIQEHNMYYPIIDQDEAKSILVYLRDIYKWRGILPYIMLLKDGQIEQVFKGGEDSTFESISQVIEEIN